MRESGKINQTMHKDHIQQWWPIGFWKLLQRHLLKNLLKLNCVGKAVKRKLVFFVYGTKNRNKRKTYYIN